MRIADNVKKSSIILLISLLITALIVPTVAWARTEARYELISGNAIFGNDFGATTCKQALFHQQTVNTTDFEALNISFPVDIGGLSLGPTGVDLGVGVGVNGGAGIGTDGTGIGAGNGLGGLGAGVGATATGNIVPFGPVNLAFPSISQTVDQTYSASETGFYSATFLGIPPINYGGSPVSSNIYASSSPVNSPTSLIGSDMMFPEMNNIIPGYDRSKAASNTTKDQGTPASGGNTGQNSTTNIRAPALINDTIGGEGTVGNSTIFNAQLSSQANQTQGEHVSISGQELVGAATSVPLNYTGTNVTGQNLSYPYFKFAATSGMISNESLLDRMWRNSHLGTMGRAYEGDTSYPDWILPTENTKSAIAMFNWTEVNNIALNQTKPGTQLIPRFWSLGITSLNNIQGNFDTIPDVESNLINKANVNTNKSVFV